VERSWKFKAGGLVVLLVVLGAAAPSYLALFDQAGQLREHEERIDAQDEQLERHADELATHGARIAVLESRVDVHAQRLDAAEAAVASLDAEVAAQSRRLAAVDARIAELESAGEADRARLEALREFQEQVLRRLRVLEDAQAGDTTER